MGDPIPIKSDSFRMDFKIRVLNAVPDGVVEMAFIPDPERYEWLDDDQHGRVLRDINTNTMIPESVLAQAAQHVVGVPIYAPPSDLPTLPELLAQRRRLIEVTLGDCEEPEALGGPSPDALAEKVGRKQGWRCSPWMSSAPPVIRPPTPRDTVGASRSSFER